MSCTINTQRACWAKAGLEAFQRIVNEADCGTAMSDLIADLGHLAKKRNLDYVAILRRGIGAWAYEERNPDGDGRTPAVSIRIAFTPPSQRLRSRRAKAGVA